MIIRAREKADRVVHDYHWVTITVMNSTVTEEQIDAVKRRIVFEHRGLPSSDRPRYHAHTRWTTSLCHWPSVNTQP